MVLGFLTGIISSLVVTAIAPFQYATNRVSWNKLPVQLLSVVAYAESYRLGHITKDDYYQYCREQGLDHNQALLAFRNTDQWLTGEQASIKRIADSMNNVISYYDQTPDGTFDDSRLDVLEETYCREMFAIGYSKTEAQKLFRALRPVPTFSILLEWLAKEAFEPLVVERFGLKDDYPKVFRDIMRSLKVPDNEAQRYWIAHWVHPAPGQMVEMFRRLDSRRDDINPALADAVDAEIDDLKMSKDDLTEALKLVELPPYWRDRLVAIGFNPLPFSVLQQGYTYGLKPDSWFLGRLKDYGYAGGDAEYILSIWRIKFPYLSKAPLSQNVLKLLERGEIDKARAVRELTDIGIPNDAAEFVAGVAADKQYLIKEKAAITSWKKLYKNKAITDDALLLLIKQRVRSDARADEVLSIIKSADDSNFKRIRFTDIRRGFSDGKITAEEAKAKLRDLRMYDDDLDFFITLFDPSTGGTTQEEQEEQ